VARAAERNLGSLAVNEVAEVDEAIAAAVQYAGPDALVMVTNNYSLGEIGPMSPLPAAQLVSLPPTMNADGTAAKPAAIPMAPPPQPAWLAGPGGPPVTRAQAQWLAHRTESGWFGSPGATLLQPQPALRFQTQAVPLAEPAWLASRGEGSAQLRGFLSNTDIFDIVSEQF
jgi:hypothetical protein